MTRLKDGFPALGLTIIPVSEDDKPFDLFSIPHARDMAVVSTWFMLREIEMAAARASHLRVDSFEVFILIPTYKTDTFGKLTERSLKCTCRVRRHPMCPYHAAVRHLARLHNWKLGDGAHLHPLFPDTDGSTPSIGPGWWSPSAMLSGRPGRPSNDLMPRADRSNGLVDIPFELLEPNY